MLTGIGRSRAEQAEALAAAGRLPEAFRRLSDPPAGQDADALFLLASWRLAGDRIRRDLGEARRLFGCAADLGHPLAATIHIALLANGTGGSRHWQDALDRLARRASSEPAAARESTLLSSMTLDAEGDPLSSATGLAVGSSPDVLAFPALLTAQECRYLIDVATPRLQPSVVVDPRSGRFVRDPVRGSAAAAFPFVLEAPAVHAINRRIARATGTLPAQGEPVQLLRYQPGEEYKPHSDALAGAANQRVLTVLVYLNDDYEGGETLFLRSGLKLRGRVGDAIAFRNVTADGLPDPDARHAGLPVVRGEKFLLSRWIRSRPLDLTGPPGRPY